MIFCENLRCHCLLVSPPHLYILSLRLLVPRLSFILIQLDTLSQGNFIHSHGLSTHRAAFSKAFSTGVLHLNHRMQKWTQSAYLLQFSRRELRDMTTTFILGARDKCSLIAHSGSLRALGLPALVEPQLRKALQPRVSTLCIFPRKWCQARNLKLF